MLQNFSKSDKYRWRLLLVYPLWIYLGFNASQLLIYWLIDLMKLIGFPFKAFDEAVLATLIAAVIYVITIVITIVLPWKLLKKPTTREELGLSRLPTWTDIFMAPAATIIYFVLSAILVVLATSLFPGSGAEQQTTGFEGLSKSFELVLAFITLVVVAPIAEETLFRGYLFGKLRQHVPVWAAALVTSALFGFVHGSFILGVDTFALSLVLCYLRQSTGSIWASILVHMTKNGIAYFILFISPLLAGKL